MKAKKLLATLLGGAMALSMMLPGVFAGETADAAALPTDATITVDGVKEAAWDAATEYTMTGVVTGDSTGDAATRGDSSTVKFRMLYDATTFYMLVEITDDAFITGASDTHWKNDSLFMYISEDGTTKNKNSEKSYILCAYPENADGSAGTGLIVRNGDFNTKEKAHAVTVDGNKAVMEFSFRFNTITPAAGGSFVMDLQYNDQDSAPSGSNTRTIVWSWSTNKEFGPNQNAGDWGTVNFAEAPCQHTETELKDAKEPTESEEGYTGDLVCKACGETVEKGETVPVKTPETKPETKPALTGDTTAALALLAAFAVAAGAVVIRRRKIEE